MATPTTDTQLERLRLRTGESSDTSQGRFTTAQLLEQLNASRNEVAEQTRCYQVKDSIAFTVAGSLVAPVSVALPTAGDPFIVSCPNDFIWVELLTWEGRPLRSVRPADWADVVGQDDAVVTDPCVFMFFGRQLQIFGVPASAGTLKYRGWAYPTALTSGGSDASFTERMADVGIWHAAATLKGMDERDSSFAEKQTGIGIAALQKQYMPRGARYVKTGDLYLPARPLS